MAGGVLENPNLVVPWIPWGMDWFGNGGMSEWRSQICGVRPRPVAKKKRKRKTKTPKKEKHPRLSFLGSI